MVNKQRGRSIEGKVRKYSRKRSFVVQIRGPPDLVKAVSRGDLQHVRQVSRAYLPPGGEVSSPSSPFLPPSFLPLLLLLLLLLLPFAVTRQKLVACLAKCSPVAPCPWSSSFQKEADPVSSVSSSRSPPFSSRSRSRDETERGKEAKMLFPFPFSFL